MALWIGEKSPFAGPAKPPGFFEGLLLCVNSISIFGSEFNLSIRDRLPGSFRQYWRAILLLVLMSMAAAAIEPSTASWILPAVLATKPIFRAIRRKSLGNVVFEFPRTHGGLWEPFGLAILIGAVVLFVASIVRGSMPQAVFNLAIGIGAESFRRNAGRNLVREHGIESRFRLIGWADLNGYEWFEHNDGEWLRLKHNTYDIWIQTPPVKEATAFFTQAGLHAA